MMKLKLVLFFIMTLLSPLSYADTASATQHVRIIIPKIAMIDVNNTAKPLHVTLKPMTEAGDNFAEQTFISYYDVTSNIRRLNLYAQSDKDLVKDYNISLKVHEWRSIYSQIGPVAKKVSYQGEQAQKDQPLSYKIKPADATKTIPHGNIEMKLTYTLVEY